MIKPPCVSFAHPSSPGEQPSLDDPHLLRNQSPLLYSAIGFHGHGRAPGELQQRNGGCSAHQRGARNRGEAHHHQYGGAGPPHTASLTRKHPGAKDSLVLSLHRSFMIGIVAGIGVFHYAVPPELMPVP